MKRELNNIEIINKITEAYFEVLINDAEEYETILKEANIDIPDLDLKTNLLINKLNRDVTIKLNTEKQLNLYERAKEIIQSLPNIEDYFNSIAKSDFQQFELAFRNVNQNLSDSDLKREFIILKIMEKLKKENESRESKE